MILEIQGFDLLSLHEIPMTKFAATPDHKEEKKRNPSSCQICNNVVLQLSESKFTGCTLMLEISYKLNECYRNYNENLNSI